MSDDREAAPSALAASPSLVSPAASAPVIAPEARSHLTPRAGRLQLAGRSSIALAAAGGGVFALSSPPTNLYPAIVVGLGLLAASLAAQGPGLRLRTAFACGAVWGTAAGIVGLRFVPTVIQRFTNLGVPASLLALILLAAAQSLVWAIGATASALLMRRLRAPLEIGFGVGVLVAVSLPSIFVWSPAGLLSPWPAVVQLADVVGERGVSVLLAIGAASFVAARATRQWKRAIVGVVVFAGLPLHGAWRIASIEQAAKSLPYLRVGLVDQAIDPVERWEPANYPRILQSLRKLTAEVEARGADLTVWPEGAYPYEVGHDEHQAPRGPRAILGDDVHGPLLVGLITSARPVRGPTGEVEIDTFNSAALVSAPGVLSSPTDKLQLLWFGETVPGGAYFPWLRRLFQRTGALLPGGAPVAQQVPASSSAPSARLAVLNCYEDTLPDVGRHVANDLEPELLVNITNDAWFGGTAAPELHARLAVMRAVELRLDLVRAVNRGVTSWIDAAGVVRARRDDASPGVSLVTPAVRASKRATFASRTIYGAVGDLLMWGLLGGATLVAARRARRRERIEETRARVSATDSPGVGIEP